MKFLITGGLGHIGSKLIREYAKREDVELIRVMDNFLVQRYCSLFDLPSGKKYEFVEGDIRNNDDLERVMKDIDVVIHLASITDAPSTISNPEETERVNFEGTKNVLNAAIKAGVKKFLFPSSTSVYGEAEGIVDEHYNNFKPSTPYAETKLASERFLQEVGKSGKIHTVILRMGTIFGTSIGMRFHTAINKFCYLAAMNKPLIVWDSALNSKRPYLGLDDDIRAFEFLEKNGISGEVYNIVTKNFSMQEIIETIKEYMPNTRIEITKSPIINQKPYHVSNDKIRALGFEFKDDLKKSVKESLGLFKPINNLDFEESQKFHNKTILITGGLGFIGSNLAKRLVKLNPGKIIIVDSLVNGLGGDLKNVREIIEKNNVKIFSGPEWDIKNIEKIKPLIKESDFIFNLSGSIKHTPFGEKEMNLDIESNFLSQVYFLEACRQIMDENVGKKLTILFAGTRDQYGKVQKEDLPINENYSPRELTDYQSINKHAAESYHLTINHVLREQGKDAKIISVRLTNTYGPNQFANAGAAIPVFINKAMKGEQIELWGGGEVLRDINYIDDVIDAFLLLCSSGVGGEIYNLGCCAKKEDILTKGIGENLVSIKELAEKIIKIAGRGEIKIIPYPSERKVVEPGNFIADISKISKLGWQPKTNLEEGLRKTIEWHKLNNSY